MIGRMNIDKKKGNKDRDEWIQLAPGYKHE
jgi:hypothetical protein